MQTPRVTLPIPWYRQAWPWFLIALPASAVVGGIITIVIAVTSADSLVVQDYYKEGLAVNRVTDRLQTAYDQSIEGLLRFDGQRLMLTLPAAGTLHKQIELRLAHATRAELDTTVTLTRNLPGHYSAELPALSAGHWYLSIAPDDAHWEIRAHTWIDGPFQVRLSGLDTHR